MQGYSLLRRRKKTMAINWKAFYANGGYSNENSDPLSYDDGEEDDENERCVRRDFNRRMFRAPYQGALNVHEEVFEVVKVFA